MSPAAASMGSGKPSKKRKPKATPPESGETVYDTAATMESGVESEVTVYDTAATVESNEEIQEPEQQKQAGGEEPEQPKDKNEEQETGANSEGLQLGYCVVPSEKRFLVLYALLKKKLSKKVMVLFSSCSSVKYHAELLSYLQMECAGIHEKQKQQERTATFSNFCMSEKGILLCTNVAARGLDIPDVDYIVQYDPLGEPQDYIHNVERIAISEKGKASVLLFLLPQELKLLTSLGEANIRLTEYKFNNKNVPNLQAHFEKIVGENYFLHQSAQEAYRSYILAYSSDAMKETFDVRGLILKDVAASFSITNPQRVNVEPENSATRKVDCGGKRRRP